MSGEKGHHTPTDPPTQASAFDADSLIPPLPRHHSLAAASGTSPPPPTTRPPSRRATW